MLSFTRLDQVFLSALNLSLKTSDVSFHPVDLLPETVEVAGAVLLVEDNRLADVSTLLSGRPA